MGMTTKPTPASRGEPHGLRIRNKTTAMAVAANETVRCNAVWLLQPTLATPVATRPLSPPPIRVFLPSSLPCARGPFSKNRGGRRKSLTTADPTRRGGNNRSDSNAARRSMSAPQGPEQSPTPTAVAAAAALSTRRLSPWTLSRSIRVLDISRTHRPKPRGGIGATRPRRHGPRTRRDASIKYCHA